MLTIPKDLDQTEEYVQLLRENLKPVHSSDPLVLRFIDRYIHSRDLAQAAKESDITWADAKNLYNRADIFKTIEAITMKASVKYGYDAAEVVEKTKELAYSDPADLMHNDGHYHKDIRKVPDRTRRAIKKMKVKNIFELDANNIPIYKGEIIEYEFWDKPRALELLGREKDTFKKTTVVEHDVSKNAREFLLVSNQLANARDVTMIPAPQQQLSQTEIVIPDIAIPKPPGVK